MSEEAAGAAPDRVPHVLLVCCGLEHARRGFETFARECFDVLKAEPRLYIELVKGSGPPGPRESSVPTLRRDQLLARGLGRILKIRPFRLEALAFAASLQAIVARRKPDVVYLSEWDTARALSLTRSLFRQRFKLVLCNGTLAAEGFEHLDRVQDLTPAAQDYVLARGADPRRHVMLPLGFRIPEKLACLSDSDRRALRRRLGLPEDRQIVISVAALNRYHKRLDYVIEEVASIPERRPFLLLAGQPEEETPGLRSLALQRLGAEGHSIRTVSPPEVRDLCRASDAFVLASTFEGLPRALVEASALGLPCLAHSYPISEFALGPYGLTADLLSTGSLAQLLTTLDGGDLSPQRAEARHRYAYEHFSWNRLRPLYTEMLRGVADCEPEQKPQSE